MARVFTAIILILFSLGSNSQEAFYKHLEGKVGANIHIVVDLVKSGERLSGYYYYYFDDRSGDTSWVHYGKSMPVSGSIRENDIEFREYDPELKGAVFHGIIENDTVIGTWRSSDGKKQLPLDLKESYANGSMPFSALYMLETGQLFPKKVDPKATFEVSLLIPGEFPDPTVADSVKKNIYDHFFENQPDTGNPRALLTALRDLYFNNYRNSNADLYQDGANSFDWIKRKEIRVLHNDKDVLSLEYYNYGFTGGAHGLSLSKFQVLNLKDGHIISLDEIFRDDFKNDLRDIINSSARKKYKLERNQGLTNAGFFIDFLDPTDNFYVTKDGIGFYYNQYEVAPFALGPVEIFVSYRDLLRILRPDSPVQRLVINGN